jgi:hypothetical protein
LNRVKAQAEIRRLAADRGNLRFTRHALTRDPEHNKFPISERQAAQCLQNGILWEDPAPDIKLANGWKFTMGRKMEEVEIVVAGVLVPQDMLLVITGFENRLTVPRVRLRPAADVGGVPKAAPEGEK